MSVDSEIQEILARYLNGGLPYSYDRGPREVPDLTAAQQDGLNCIALVHLLLRDLYEVTLSADLRCYEMFYDLEHFEEIPDLQKLQTGDVIFVGPRLFQSLIADFQPIFDEQKNLVNHRDFPLHLVVCVGFSPQQEPLFIHANYVDKTVGVWPLSQLQSHRRYAVVYKIKRLKSKNTLE